MKKCPRCSYELSLTDKACPKCGLTLAQMDEISKKFNLSSGETETAEENKRPTKKDIKQAEKEERRQAKQEKKNEKRKKKEINEIDFSQFAVNSGASDPDEILETDTFTEKRKKRKKLQAKPRFLIDENGEFDINTSDVEIVGEKTGKELSQQFEQSYSIKKSRGDYIPPKIKWWEIYKVADRHFARSKIKKEVNKAAKIKPNFVKKSTLVLLTLFLGWTGAQNFYAKNTRKGWFSLICLFIWIGVVSLAYNNAFFASIQTSIGGGAGFLCLFVWVSDIISIISNQFKYKFQRDRFIAGLNVATRAKLGKKYIDMDLYRKPLWYRFKVWCGELKRNSEIRKRERRQAAIEREKEKLAKQEEKDKIDSEIAAFEAKENAELSKNKVKNIIGEQTIDDIKTFSKDISVEELNGTDENSLEQDEKAEVSDKTHKSSFVPKKYNKTVKNKKAEKKKKKK